MTDHPSWLCTMGVPPWPEDEPPPLTAVPGLDQPQSSRPDIFHIGPLGVCRDLYLGGILILIHLSHFLSSDGSRALDSKLKSAFKNFKQFCQEIHETPTVKEWTKENFRRTSAGAYPDCSFKASDAHLILKWLENYLNSGPWRDDEGVLELLLTAVGNVNRFYRTCFSKVLCCKKCYVCAI